MIYIYIIIKYICIYSIYLTMQEWAKAYDIKSVHHAFASCMGCLNHQSEFRVAEMVPLAAKCLFNFQCIQSG